MFVAFTWLLTVLSVIGVVLNARKDIRGFYFWIFGNLGWVVVNLHKGIYAQVALFAFYFLMCIYGIYTWRKKEKE